MKLSRSTSHVILSPELASLVLCAMRLRLKQTNGRKVGAGKASGGGWTRTGRLIEDGGAIYRKDAREL